MLLATRPTLDLDLLHILLTGKWTIKVKCPRNYVEKTSSRVSSQRQTNLYIYTYSD